MHVELVNPLAYMYTKRKVGDRRYPLRYGVFITGAVVTMRAYNERFSNSFEVVQPANSVLLTFFLLLTGRVLLSAFYGLL